MESDFFLALIIPAPHHYAYFVQFDWLVKNFYTLIDSMRRSLRTIVFLVAPNLCHNVDINTILMKKLE